ncbi:hypothetical protein [Paraburkholderia saeva]|uniref:hypothetical protein n=1 Tax=Paraburkholderia saeva TaxID=2777537 RepID=UPI001D7818D2|nr:hypothetical protein [Paraburkholderia saeva]CAG4898883.1 hypothetical protein R70241_02540 [Paraburkholderia saeva]
MNNAPNPAPGNPDEADEHDRPDGEAPNDLSVPLGDAIPTPVEPGLDQPLPEKSSIEPTEEESTNKNRP